MSVNDIWNKSYLNCGNEMKMKKWSSQWTQFMQLRKEDWKKFRTLTGSNAVEVLNFFQASLSNCINCVHCDDHFFIFIFQSTICCFRKRWQQNLPEKKKKWAQTKKTKDSQLVFHAFHLPKQPFKAIIVSSEETDVRLLCLAFSNIINVPIFQSMRFTISRLVHWH